MNDTHRRVGYLFPESIAPRFSVKPIDEGSFYLDYHSRREGFHPFVAGLVQGLAEAFSVEVHLEYIPEPEGQRGCESFRITHSPAI